MNHRTNPPANPWIKIAPFAVISWVSFLCGAGLLSVMIWNAEKLAALGLTGNLFYVVLLPLALSAAAFLFGILQSYASYRGKHLGGVLNLGGPVVAAALVVIGGFVLVPSVAPFDLTAYVHGEKGPNEMVLRNSGYVLLDLGPDRRRESIGDKGEAHFSGIPATFRGQEVTAWVESDNFESIDAARKRRLDGSSIYLIVHKKSGRVSGRVQDQNGNAVPGAQISLAGQSASADQFGHFEINVPGERLKPELDLYAQAPGYRPEHYKVVPNANEATLTLTKAH